MTNNTIKRIKDNGTIANPVKMGRYLYAYDVNTGEIKRCKSDDYGRQWIDSDGEMYDGWETIHKAH